MRQLLHRNGHRGLQASPARRLRWRRRHGPRRHVPNHQRNRARYPPATWQACPPPPHPHQLLGVADWVQLLRCHRVWVLVVAVRRHARHVRSLLWQSWRGARHGVPGRAKGVVRPATIPSHAQSEGAPAPERVPATATRVGVSRRAAANPRGGNRPGRDKIRPPPTWL